MLEDYLPGIRDDDREEYWMLAHVLENWAFEIQKREGAEDIYDVPYMMNDALECCLVFTGASMQGEFEAGIEADTTASLVRGMDRQGLIIRQGEENTCTLWFSHIHRELQCYCFHMIGHFWEKGAQQWRRLVYIIGTMQDKYLFLGEEACNEEEKELIPLMEFTPFYRYYPAKICIPEEYVTTEEGCLCMLRMAEEAKDRKYAAAIRLYLRFPCAFLEKKLHRMLMDVDRGRLYDLLCQKARTASEKYPKRDYGEEKNQRLKEQRDKLDQELKMSGHTGTYPDYRKGRIQIQVAEEHPFTRMESFEEGLKFWFMVSEQPENMKGSNRGFFRGRHLKGSICSPEQYFEEDKKQH